MRQGLQKIRFVHGRLWRRDPIYPFAFVFGPASLLGVLFALAVWAASNVRRNEAPVPPAAWGKPNASAQWWGGGERRAVSPAAPLPPAAADGALGGYEPGWSWTLHRLQIDAALDADVSGEALKGFGAEGLIADMAKLAAEGPKDSLYAGVGKGMFVAKVQGAYALSARLDREAGLTSNCLVRLVFSGKRVISNMQMNIADRIGLTYDAAEFDLDPGLYPIAWAFACWRGQTESEFGRMTVLLRRLGEDSLTPLRPGEIVRSGTNPP